MAGVNANDFLIDRGSGDGRIIINAARERKARGFGVDYDSRLVKLANENARKAGVSDRASFFEQNIFQTDLGAATVVTMYLLPEVNLQLRPGLLALKPGTRLVSHDWDMGDWIADRSTVLQVPDKKVGREKSSKVQLWVVPARVDGLWCGSGVLGGAALRLGQKYQNFEGNLAWRDRSRAFVGQIAGFELRAVAGRHGELRLQARGDDRLQVLSSRGELELPPGWTFRRATSDRCD